MGMCTLICIYKEDGNYGNVCDGHCDSCEWWYEEAD